MGRVARFGLGFDVLPYTGDSLQAQLERYQRRFRVLRGVMLATRDRASADEAISAFLEAVCNGFGWPVGLYLAHTPDGQVFSPTQLRFPSNGSQQLVRALHERPRSADPGSFDASVVGTRSPQWVPNVTLEPSFEVAKQAVALGVRGLVGIPVLAGRQTYGLVEFFTREEFSPSPDQVEYLADLGALLGMSVHFHETDRRLRNSSRTGDGNRPAAQDDTGDGGPVFDAPRKRA